jgi:hypothetical protein
VNDMPYKNPDDRNLKREYKLQVERGELPKRMERQRARRALDAKGVDRTGKDVSHNVPFVKGGDNKDGYKLESPHTNRARNYKKLTKP